MENETGRLKSYTLPPEVFESLRRRALHRQAILSFGVVLVVAGVSLKQLGTSLDALIPLLIIIPVIVLALVYGAILGLKRQKDALLSYELLVGEDFILRRRRDLPELELGRDEIVAVRESSDGLVIQAGSRDRFIMVPKTLAGFDEVKERVTQWVSSSEVKPSRVRLNYAAALALPIVVLLLFGGLFLAERSWMQIGAGIPLIVLLAWSVVATATSSHIPRQTKRMLPLIALPMLAIMYRVIAAIANWR